MRTSAALMLLACGLLAGCRMPGRPAAGDIPQRPDQISDLQTLYSSNCAGCHGAQGKGGAAISLASPVYLAYAGEANLARLIAEGVPGSLMPAFGQRSGGLLTEAQVQVLAHGMVANWGSPVPSQAAALPPFAGHAAGDAGRGEVGYKQLCVRCHAPGRGSVLDPTYLALISDQGLRSVIVAGKPEQGMPDWSGYGGTPLNDAQVSDLVAFLAAHRAPASTQPEAAQANSKPAVAPDQAAPAGKQAAEKVSHR